MHLTSLKSVIASDLIDRWVTAADTISFEDGKVMAEDGSKHDPNSRICQIRWIQPSKHVKLYNSIANNIWPYVDAEMGSFRVDIYRTLEVQYTTYLETGFYRRHTDIDVISSRLNSKTRLFRKISIVVMLSDPSEYDGGDLIVGQKVASKEKGTIHMFFPMTNHEVKPVTRGIRRTLVAWVLGPEWR